MHGRTCVLSLLAACSDYELQPSDGTGAIPNPPTLETPTTTDRIVQVPQPSCDVLFVVDDTPTMDDDQANLSTNFPSFMTYFLDSGLDYHIGVISTSTEDEGKLMTAGGVRWVDPATPDAVGVFVAMTDAVPARQGFAYDEAGISTTYMALVDQAGTYNLGFRREQAGLSVIVLTDEDDQSVPDGTSPGDLINYLNGLPVDPQAVSFSSIVCHGTDYCATASGGGTVGTRYMLVSDLVGGIVWPINDTDFSDALDALGIQAVGLKREFFLSQLPVPETIAVSVTEPDGIVAEYVGTDDCDTGGADSWEYDAARNSVSFCDYVPSPLAEVSIVYDERSWIAP